MTLYTSPWTVIHQIISFGCRASFSFWMSNCRSQRSTGYCRDNKISGSFY